MPITKATASSIAPAAKGDLVVGSATNDASVLAVGSANQVLTVDSSTSTGLKWAAPAASGALTLVKEQTIGSAVASVTVTGAFSATYDNYLIIVSDGSGTGNNTVLTLGATTANYYMTGVYFSPTASTVTGFNINDGANWTGTYVTTSNNSGHINLQSPYLSKRTTFSSVLIGADSGSNFALYQGFLANTTSYTDFTLTPASGTLTGGKIRVYGYQNS